MLRMAADYASYCKRYKPKFSAHDNGSTSQPTTRASRNAGGVKQSRPALRKARDVGMQVFEQTKGG